MASASSAEPAAPMAQLPATGLYPDTKIAAPGAKGDGLGYIGVWAKDAAGCAQIDQSGAADFAVITRSTFRNGTNACFGNFGAMADGKLSLSMGCTAGPATVALAQSTPDTLQVNDGPTLIRCKP